MSHLFLTGFMGAGKSTVGLLVAERLGVPFVDLDAVVEEREGRGIPAIFAESGEEAFRCAETDALASLAREPDAVVACGGGVVLRDENRVLLKRLGRVVYLVVTAEEALARLGDDSGRPLLEGEAGRMASTLLEGRSALYAAVADERIETSGRTPGQVADDVIRIAAEAGHTTTIPVEIAEHPYGVLVGRGLLASLGERVAHALPKTRRVAVVADSTVGRLYGSAGEESLRAAGLEALRFDVPPGESSKSWSQAGELVAAFASAGLDRDSAVVALGGGVVGDLAGFCAATYLRGIALVQVPTTLLAQVDSSIGGKTGVDLPSGKNLAGAFWQPVFVLSDTSLLTSLPEGEWRSGLAEVAKSAVLSGERDLEWLEGNADGLVARDPEAVERAVQLCVRYKAAVVAGDERESGARECLNLGHTLGHAIEKVAGFGVVSHGAAVAEGMRFAAALATDLGVSDAGWATRQEELLDALGLVTGTDRFNAAALHETMRADKKARSGRIRFVLATAPGRCEVREVADGTLAARLADWEGSRG